MCQVYLLADIADVRLLAGVDAQVALELLGLGKAAAAAVEGAHVPVFVRIAFLVGVQRLERRKVQICRVDSRRSL